LEKPGSQDNFKRRRFGLNRNAWVFLVCILVATLGWFLNALAGTYPVQRSFPVKFVNLPVGYPGTLNLPDSIRVELKATGFNFLFGRLGGKVLVFDCSNPQRKNGSNQLFILTYTRLPKIARQLGSDFELVSIDPDTLYFVRPDAPKKNLPVVFKGRIQLPPNYFLLDSIKLNPPLVEVIGYNPDMKLIETEARVFHDVTGLMKKKVALVNPGPKGTHLYPDSVEIEVRAEKFTEQTFLVNVSLVNLPPDVSVKVFPRQVKVKCLVPLSELEKITPGDFQAVVDYLQIDLKKDKKAAVHVSTGLRHIKNLRAVEEQVEFIIRKL
jgi:hypothetical protein